MTGTNYSNKIFGGLAAVALGLTANIASTEPSALHQDLLAREFDLRINSVEVQYFAKFNDFYTREVIESLKTSLNPAEESLKIILLQKGSKLY